MRRGRLSDQQIVEVLREQEAGTEIPEVCRCRGIPGATRYEGRAKDGGIEVSVARSPKRLIRLMIT